MPYVYYDELPDGLEAVDVIEQANYDALADELAGAIAQRDEALEKLEESRKETRAAKAKYANAVLGGKKDEPAHNDDPNDGLKGATIRSLFE